MARAFKLPDLGEGIHEGEILNVLVSPGDHVKEGDPILEVETDKATVEIPSPFTGTVEEIKVKAGDTVKVGDVLMTFSDVEAEGEKPPVEKKEEKRMVLEKKAAPPETKERVPEKEETPSEKPVPASPTTRRLARELNVDLHQVTPSGPGGQVTSEDVRAFAEKGKGARPEKGIPPKREEKAAGRPIEEKAPRLPDFTKWGEVERLPVRSVRRATARQMALSWSQIPHVHNLDMVDMTRLEALRKKYKKEVEEKGGKLSVTVFALKAVAAALKQHPRFKASLDMEAGEMILKHYYHIGVAVSAEDGLIVPVIRDVDRKSMVDLSIELKDLAQRTRERKLDLEELQGGVFTITNVGPMGGGFFAPIINFPEVAILGMGTTRMQPVAMETPQGRYEIVARPMMPIVLCIDHRVLDGADALSFTRVLIKSLEDPEALFMTMT